ncbi:MAG TPA: GFA family protein [Cellvibrionaceae bacterium]
MINGSCCCGAVKFSLASKPEFLAICHCSRCRKLGSSEFFMVQRDSLQWISGKELVAEYVPEPPFKYKRCFCSVCGTSLGEILSTDKQFPIAANSLDSDPDIKVWLHEHVASKPSWQLLHKDAKLFDGDPQ